jgi:hypothetical protein
MVFVDKIPAIKEASDMCNTYNIKIAKILESKPYKKVNVNLAVLSNGIITEVHKGTADEVNNCLYLTYQFHPQYFPNQIERLIERDVELKVIRCARIILSFISRTQYRDIVKKALQGDFNDKLDTLMQIDFSKIDDLGTKGPSKEDVYKAIGFQFGQTIGLMDSVELYSKESVCEYYPELEPFVMRMEHLDLNVLNEYCKIFIRKSQARKIKLLIEPKR